MRQRRRPWAAPPAIAATGPERRRRRRRAANTVWGTGRRRALSFLRAIGGIRSFRPTAAGRLASLLVHLLCALLAEAGRARVLSLGPGWRWQGTSALCGGQVRAPPRRSSRPWS
ncbi:unnamed protein product [Prorocentrum cordatum]|uniref:Uncharacterized protein n=1 Tax=Prorocentrum cordatum TaxID=2364126 RepID=A0ABN9WUT4_9DINO|nr:unnamed protein product [Polarella glacialis]